MTDLLRRQPEPLVVRPHDAMRILSCSRATLYRLLNHGEIEGYLHGTARLISVSSIKAYIARKLKAEPRRRMPAPPERRFYRPQHPSVPARRQGPEASTESAK
jgi:excisionase family DNA binding protein